MKRLHRPFAAIWPLLLLSAAAVSISARPLTPAEQQRAGRLYTIFVAPCCWQQSVAVHQSPEALNVRRQIDNRVAAGLTDDEIKSDLIHEYGHGILLEPEGFRAVAAYGGPVLATCAALLIAILWVRHLAAARETSTQPVESIAEFPAGLDDE